MNRILLACASALALTAATAADAQTVRFTGNIKGTSTPFSVTYGVASESSGIFLTNNPLITVGGTAVTIPDLWPVLAQQQAEYNIGANFVTGWQDYYSDVETYGSLNAFFSIADLQSGAPYIESSYLQTLNGNFENLYFNEEQGYYDVSQTHRFDGVVELNLVVDFFDGYSDGMILDQRRTFQQIGNTLVYDFTPPFFGSRFGGDEWDPRFTLTASAQAFEYVTEGGDTYTVPVALITPISLIGQITRLEIGELGSLGMPVLPTSITPDNGFVFVQLVFPNTPVFFDPPVSVGYDYSVTLGSPLITRAMFPTLLGDLDGFDIFALGGGGSPLFSDVMGGDWVDFTSIGFTNGISGFSLRDINPALELDPANPTAFVTGLEFATSGTVNLTQTPVTIEWPIPGGGGGGGGGGGAGVVPEPASWAMLIAGFGLTGVAMRRRRRAMA